MRICDLCGINEAIYTDTAKGVSLCSNCLMSSVRKRAWEILEKELIKGDRIVVAHSGGKDSSLALVLTKEFSDAHPEMDLDIVSVIIDEGTFYRKASIELAERLSNELGVKHLTFTIEEIHGLSIGELEGKLPKDSKRSVCTYCGVLRRQALNAVAREMGATVVITGHNLDDMVQTALMNLARGDINALVKTLRHKRNTEEGLIPRVRPLKYVYEREIAALVVAEGITAHLGKCPLTQGMRIGVRREIDRLEDMEAGAKIMALKIFNFISSGIKPNVKLRRCKICGEPTTTEICKACQFKAELSEILGRDLLKPLNLNSVRKKGWSKIKWY